MRAERLFRYVFISDTTKPMSPDFPENLVSEILTKNLKTLFVKVMNNTCFVILPKDQWELHILTLIFMVRPYDLLCRVHFTTLTILRIFLRLAHVKNVLWCASVYFFPPGWLFFRPVLNRVTHWTYRRV